MTRAKGPVSSFVCLHGFTGTPDSFAPLSLKPVWAPFLTGHGPDPDFSSRTFEAEVERLGAGIAARAREPVHLVGYSMGARMALGLLCSFPHLFHRATLLGANPGLESKDARQERLLWEAGWIKVLEQDGLAVFEEEWRNQALFKTQLRLPPDLAAAQKNDRLSHTSNGLAHALQVLGLGSMPNFWPHLASVKTPLTLVHGALDEKFSAISKRAHSLCPQIREVAIPGVGHNPLIEAPRALSELLLSL